MRIYLDTCCLNRPFDDQSQERVRLESEAVMLIHRRVVAGDLFLIASSLLVHELMQGRDEKRQVGVLRLLSQANVTVKVLDSHRSPMVS